MKLNVLVTACACLPLLAAPPCHSQAANVHEVSGRQQWVVNAGETTYVLGVNDQGVLQSMYFDARLGDGSTLPPAHMYPERASFDPPIMTTPLEYPAWGAGLALEPAFKASFSNGDRNAILKFEAASIKTDELEVTLRDTYQPLRVHLHYKPYPEGVIARWSTVENVGKDPVRLEQAASATLNLPISDQYTWQWLTGEWGGEWQLHNEPLQTGIHVLESRRGSTSHQDNPWFAVGKQGTTTETFGPVWFGELGWSGNWRITLEHTSLGNVRITGGYSPFDFAWNLKPGESLETPRFYTGFTLGGNGEASRILHRFQLAEILPAKPSPRPRPVIYNSWEATEFHVDEAGQAALAEKAAALGVERFVIDDGWFGARETDHAGLGDWTINPKKFPHGLAPVIERVRALGMDFGLWVEPEMVNPDSDLYRAHPDWVLNFPVRQRTEARNQLVLNLARPEVRAYVFSFLDKLLSENKIAFLKWDYNRNWSEAGWPEAYTAAGGGANGDIAAKEVYIRYVQNLYGILAELRRKHPGVEIESCSGGGGRVDLGILRYTDEVWPSDNTDALDRLSIQDGFSHAYSPETMAAWVTDVPNFLDRRAVPLKFRFLVAMQGALGIGGNLNHWTPEEMQMGTQLTAFYKNVRTTVQHGKLFRLTSPAQSEASQVEYVSSDGNQAVLFAYLHSQRYGTPYPTVQLQGLEPSAKYRVRSFDEKVYSGEKVVTGETLMHFGVPLRLGGDYDSTALLFERIP